MVQETDGASDERRGKGKRAQPVTVAVKTIRTQGQAALVEYEHQKRVRRVLVPLSALVDGEATVEDLEAGVRMSVDWEDRMVLKVTSAQLAAELRRAGVWTVADADADPGRFQKTITRIFVRQAVDALAKIRQEDRDGR